MSTDDGSGDRPRVTTADAPDRDGSSPPTGADDASDGAGGTPDGFGRQGWVLVAVVVLTVLVIPGTIYLFPALPADAGLPFLAAMLVLPLAPAALLGLVAVWSMTAAEG
ncbi:MAG: hypothetical protein ABEJ61_07075 [Haloferacaceae archaeon]